MDRNRVKRLPEVKSSASQGAGLLELWNGAGQIVWDHLGLCGLSHPAGMQRSQLSTTLAGMVLWSPRQKRPQASGTGGESVFCSFTAMDTGELASRGTASGLGVGCDHLEETFYGALYQRGLSRLRHPRVLESGRSRGKRFLATPLARVAQRLARQCALRLDGDCDE